jgi:cysteine desulfurase/selenocysteine lyase
MDREQPGPATTVVLDSALSLLRPEVIGVGERVPVLAGGRRPFINLDNAASTPALRPVLSAIEEFLRWYANVHRGMGYKSQLSSWAFERARDRVARFVGADPGTDVVLFTKNTTESINHLARRLAFGPDDVVVTTVMEHHSNELPWRRAARVVHVGVTPEGRVDPAELERTLAEQHGRVRLLAVSGASNVTGYLNPVHDFARLAHAAGARIFVDAAQLAAHRPIDMGRAGAPDRLDFLAFSAHKMYAPFGVGVLVGSRRDFEHGDPDLVGGGTVDIVTLENAYWTDLPDREEAGTPNVVGVVALGRAIEVLESMGWEAIERHEAELTARALVRLSAIPGVALYGDADPRAARERLGVIPFNVRDVPHALLAAVLSYEWAIGTRSGCFCAHPYVKEILHVGSEAAAELEREILARDRSHVPGAVRASFGIYNTVEEVDRLAEAVAAIAAGRFASGYELDRERGEWYPPGFHFDFEERFTV